MRIKFLKDNDFVNYYKCSMFIGMPFCDWKCCTEANIPATVCQNFPWFKEEIMEISNQTIIDRYLSDPLVEAIVFGGLEPMDSFQDLISFAAHFRLYSSDDVVIYTGYKEEEIAEKILALQTFPNIIVKFGRFIPNQESIFDSVLGVELASPNQYAKKIS